jgi:hypothetical protein
LLSLYALAALGLTFKFSSPPSVTRPTSSTRLTTRTPTSRSTTSTFTRRARTSRPSAPTRPRPSARAPTPRPPVPRPTPPLPVRPRLTLRAALLVVSAAVGSERECWPPSASGPSSRSALLSPSRASLTAISNGQQTLSFSFHTILQPQTNFLVTPAVQKLAGRCVSLPALFLSDDTPLV